MNHTLYQYLLDLIAKGDARSRCEREHLAFLESLMDSESKSVKPTHKTE
jgi:hypothetical protein